MTVLSIKAAEVFSDVHLKGKHLMRASEDTSLKSRRHQQNLLTILDLHGAQGISATTLKPPL